MDWWQLDSGVVATLVTGGAAVGFMWRIVRKEVGTVRAEGQKAHEQIGNAISDLRKELGGEISDLREGQTSLRRELGGEIAGLRKELGGEIADLREGQTGLREGIAGLQGEMKGMHHAVLTLRDDFRAHVLAEK